MILPILGLALLGSVFALIGGVVFLLIPSWSKWLVTVSVPFAAGVLLTVAIVGLIPESIELAGENALVVTLASFLAAYLFERIFFSLHHHDDGHHTHHPRPLSASVPLVVAGDTIHNFVDGVTIAASYLIEPGLGVVMAISTFLHEVPHEIGDFGILLKAGWAKKRIILTNLFSSMATLLGVAVIVTFPQSESILGFLVAMAAGLFLYLGATDFLPDVDEGGKSWTNILALLVGVLIMLMTLYLIPHDH